MKSLKSNVMAAILKISTQTLQAVCDVLGDTDSGLTGSEIGRMLGICRIDDVDPMLTKRYRLFEALNTRQNRDKCSNTVLHFMQKCMEPVTYRAKPELFESRRTALNEALAFEGLSVTEAGQLKKIPAAKTLTEAQARAGQLKTKLMQRHVHRDVLKFCQAELLEENYFHAVLEATKSVTEKIRNKTGLAADGAQLVDDAFKLDAPKLAFNTLQTDSEKSEHKGLMNLMKGIFGAFRNPTAHAPKIYWHMNEQDALDILTTLSLIHRRLDSAVIIPTEKPTK